MILALELWGPSHLSTLATTTVIALGMIAVARWSADPRTAKRLGWMLAIVLLVTHIVSIWWAVRSGWATATNLLPCHLCDWATAVAILALVSRDQLAYELTYFWGLAGTIQSMLTPDLDHDFPAIEFVTFFVAHGGVIVAALFLTFGYGLRPQRGALLRVFLWTNVYAALVMLVNVLTGENYGYLRAKPMNPSLLDFLGPWPFYILVLELLALLFFCILYVPFFFLDRVRRNR